MNMHNVLLKLGALKNFKQQSLGHATKVSLFNLEDFFIYWVEKIFVAIIFYLFRNFSSKSLSSSLHLFKLEHGDVLNVLYARLNVYIFFKQHPNSWHYISSLD